MPLSSHLLRSRVGVLALVVVASLAACAPDERACCANDSDCAAGALCFEGMCAPSCTDVSQCREGDSCVQGTCVASLRQAAHCPFVEKRVPGRPPLDGGVDAGGGDDAGPDTPGCDDGFEPNDERGSAHALVEATVSAAVCPARDDDFYLVSVSEPLADLYVRVSFEHADGDIDVELIDSEGNRVAVSQSASDLEEILLPVSGPRELYVHVYGFGQAINEYLLEVQLLPPAEVCLDDALEDNDSNGDPTLLAPGDDVSAVFCAGDPDVYTTALPAGVRALAILSYERGDELDLEVSEPGEGIIGASSTSSGVELLPFALEDGGTANLRVAGTHGQVEARPYDVTVRMLDGSCGFDEHEPNDVAGESVLLELPANAGFQTVQGVLCERDVDVWRLAWSPGSVFVELVLTGATGTRAYVVRESDLSLVERIAAGEQVGVFPGTNVVAGEVLIVVVGVGEDEDYELRGRAVIGE